MERTEPSTMGKRIAQLRRNKGFTQEQLAEKVGVSAQAVSKWENDISSPDISIIPSLAATLGVTTDELLGTKPIEPHVVIVEAENKDREFVLNLNKGKADGIIIGTLLVVFGVLLGLGRLGVLPVFEDATFFQLLWPLAIIFCGISWSLHHLSPLSVGVLALGGYLFAYNANWIQAPLQWSVIWPILLVLVGVSIISGFLFKKSHRFHWSKCWKDNEKMNYTDGDGFVHAECAFTGEKRQVVCEEFRGGDVEVSFGSLLLDLVACSRFSEDCALKVEVSFGSLEILLPHHVQVIRGVDNSFAACTMHGAPDTHTTGKLYLKGDVSFGSIEVHYR